MSLSHPIALPRAECAQPPEIDELPLPCLDIDPQGRIAYANRVALALHHPEIGNLVGKFIWELVAFDEKELSRGAFLALMQIGGVPPVITRNIFDRSGKFRTYQLHRTWLRDTAGHPAGMRLIGVDVSEMTEMIDRSRRACQWLESAMNSMSDAVILSDTLGVVRTANSASSGLTGFSGEELFGMAIEDALPISGDQPDASAALDHRMALESHRTGIATIVNRTGDQMKIEIRTSPIFDSEKAWVTGVVAIVRKLDEAG